MSIKKIALGACLITIFTTSEIWGIEQTRYIRKSISGPNEIWIAPNAKTYLKNDTLSFLDKTLKDSIETKRFDFNKLPTYVFEPILNELHKKNNVDENQITELVDAHVLPEVDAILNNPNIQKQRIEAQKKGLPRFTFSDSKGKAQNILLEDLDTFFNSSFIYFPFILSTTVIHKEKSIESHLTGGIIWYQIRNNGTGNQYIVRIKTIEATSKDEIPIQNNENRADKQAQCLSFAITKWCEELGIATKSLEEFQLSGQLIESIGWNYTIDLGEKQGVNLNDAYMIYDYQDLNHESLKPVGFGIITSIKQPNAILTQQLGKKQTVGSYIKEYPRLATHTQFSIGKRQNLTIKASEIEELQSDITNGLSATLRISQNLAPSTKISQFFIGIETEYTFLENTLKKNYSGSPHLLSFSMLLEKKYWYHNNAFALNIGLGHERFYLKGSSPEKSYDITLESSHLSFGLGYEKMINPNLSFVCTIEHRLTPGVQNGTLKYNNIDESKHISFASDFKNTKFGGTLIRFGLNYILPATYKLR